MKDQYFGDIQDYRKFGLLRCLQQTGSLKLLVAWLLTPDDSGTHGGKLTYLQKPGQWRRHDPELFDWLAEHIHGDQQRRVSLIEQSALLPRTRYFSDLVPDSADGRGRWSKGLSAAAAQADLVFVDPDNGLEVSSRPVGARRSSQYVYWAELQALWSGGHSLLIYQHFPRKPRDQFIGDTCADLRTHTPGSTVSTFRTPDVLFLLAAQPRHRVVLDEGTRRVSAAWAGQIECGSPGDDPAPKAPSAAPPSRALPADPTATVRRALDDLKPQLARFVPRELKRNGLSVPVQRYRRGVVDLSGLLAIVLIDHKDLFSRLLGKTEMNYLHEVQDIRNRWAHEHRFTEDEARRAVDTVRLAITAILKALGGKPPG